MQIEKGFTDWLQPTVLRKSGCVSMLAVSDSSWAGSSVVSPSTSKASPAA